MSGERAGTNRNERSRTTAKRRSFLRLAGAGAATGAAVAATGGQAAAVEAPKSKTAAGYRETEHVRKVYDLARF